LLAPPPSTTANADAVACVQGYAEPLGDLSQFWSDDELVPAVGTLISSTSSVTAPSRADGDGGWAHRDVELLQGAAEGEDGTAEGRIRVGDETPSPMPMRRQVTKTQVIPEGAGPVNPVFE
jgi:hypothetical protein